MLHALKAIDDEGRDFGADGQPTFRSFRGGSRIQLQPLSVLHGSEPALILYTKAIPGPQLHYVRDVSVIQAEWLPNMQPITTRIEVEALQH
eukprot:jgi/Pico_ML_1/55070/g821.t1